MFEFLGTSGTTTYNYQYKKLRSLKYYTEVSTNLSGNKGVIAKSTGTEKTQIINAVSSLNTQSTNAKIKIYLSTPDNFTTGAIYYMDKEFNYTSGSTLTTLYNTKTNVIGKYSDFYLDYINGEINNGDYILTNGIKNYIIM